MADGISITMRPSASAVAAGFDRLGDDLVDFRQANAAMSRLFERHEARHFATEGASTGPRFAPLSPSYAPYKAKVRPGLSILQFDGVLLGSLTRRGAPGAVSSVTANSWMRGTSVPYAKFHAEGKGNLPKRPPVRYDPSTNDPGGKNIPLGAAYARLVRLQIQGKIVKAFGKDVLKPSDRVPSLRGVKTS